LISQCHGGGQGQATIDADTGTLLAWLAAIRGQLECLRVTFRLPLILCGSIGEKAAATGHLACLRLAHEHGDPITHIVGSCAAWQGEGSATAHACVRESYISSDTQLCNKSYILCHDCQDILPQPRPVTRHGLGVVMKEAPHWEVNSRVYAL
jgi:hypothetical protein